MKKSVLIKIRESNPNFPLAEYLSRLGYCEYVDSVSSEKIDGIAKLEVEEDKLNDLIQKLNFSDEDVEEIERSYKFENRKRGKLSFWLNFNTRKEGLPELKRFIYNQPAVHEAYLTKNSIYIRGEANSMKDVDNLWRSLYREIGDVISSKGRTRTYFVFNRFMDYSKRAPLVLSESL